MIEDCRSEDGITVGLIDSVICICRVLSPRLERTWKFMKDENPKLKSTDLPVSMQEALKDFSSDEDVLNVMSWAAEFNAFPSYLTDE